MKLCDDRSNKSLYQLKTKLCRPKSNFASWDKVVTKSRKRISDCSLPNGATYIDCNSSNAIYLITSNRCSLQYVRETSQKLK